MMIHAEVVANKGIDRYNYTWLLMHESAT